MKVAVIKTIQPILYAASVLALVALVSLLSALTLTQRDSSAISGWNAGNIIDDGVFADKATMSPQSIQGFLESKVPTCDTWGTQPSEFGGGTRRQWAEARGHSPPYTCLKDYSENGRAASQIIYDISQNFSINPQVMLVLLQKEQSLVTDTWPLSIQYRAATGYGCPDTAPCDSQYYGLTNQVTWAARMFRAILNNSPTWYTPYVLGNNYIQYNPDANCGGSTVNIENRSTQALYNYTPYQPNQGALNAGWGTAPCGAYGNRNFYLYFTNWFGSTRVRFQQLQSQRWMELSVDAAKKDPYTNSDVTGLYPAGTHLRFVDKIFVNNTWYLRTEYDATNNIKRGYRIDDLRDIAPQAFAEPRYMELTSDRKKWNPITGYSGEKETFSSGSIIKFSSKVTVNGVDYYRTEFDTKNGNDLYITASAVSEITFMPFETPRYLEIKTDATQVDPATSRKTSTLTGGTHVKFTAKTRPINGIVYYQTESDDVANVRSGIPSDYTIDIPYKALASPVKWMVTNTYTQRWHPASLSTLTELPISANTPVKLAQQITVNGQVFYRTAYDLERGFDRAIPSSSLSDISYEPMEQPRSLALTKNTKKIIPQTEQESGDTFAANTIINFSQKITINGVVYLRSAYDTQNNNNLVIPLSSLRNL